jgi:hypothetical protein
VLCHCREGGSDGDIIVSRREQNVLLRISFQKKRIVAAVAKF